MYGIFIPLCTIKNHTNVGKTYQSHGSYWIPGLILFSSWIARQSNGHWNNLRLDLPAATANLENTGTSFAWEITCDVENETAPCLDHVNLCHFCRLFCVSHFYPLPSFPIFSFACHGRQSEQKFILNKHDINSTYRMLSINSDHHVLSWSCFFSTKTHDQSDVAFSHGRRLAPCQIVSSMQWLQNHPKSSPLPIQSRALARFPASEKKMVVLCFPHSAGGGRLFFLWEDYWGLICFFVEKIWNK